MKKYGFLYAVVLFALLLMVQNFMILNAVHEMSGDARVVNYSGLVRGATQRLVKLELAYHPNDELLGRLDEYLNGLDGRENIHNIVYMDYEPFQASIDDLLVIWDELQTAIYGYRAGLTSAEALLEVSERHFHKADEATHNAELGSEGKVGRTELLIRAGMGAIGFIVLIIAIALLSLRRSERKRLALLQEKNTQLEAAILQANEANRAKSIFLSHMSHDIRTPLNGILGMTTIANANASNPERLRDCFRKIESSSRHLQSLINDVLDMSKIEGGKFFLNPTILDLSAFIDDLRDIVVPQSAVKHQRLNISTLTITHNHIVADQLRLNQIFINILSNAVKFTPDNGVVSFLVKELPGKQAGHARFDFICSDTGVGMHPDFVRHMFESFTREQDSRIDKTEGSGLGLAIVKRVVDIMGGTIRVASTKNKGTTVTVSLEFPLTKAGAQAAHPRLPQPVQEETPSAGLRLDGVRALMAEDNELNTEIAIELLTTDGMEVDCAANGRQALELFRKSPLFYYDVILMDMQMPEMTGCEAAEAIRALQRTDAAQIPIIALTANAFEEDISAVLSAGMNAHVAKPVNFELLKTVIGEHLAGKMLQTGQ